MIASNGDGDLVILQSPEPVTPVHDTAAALESQLEQFKTERKQERFMWMLALIGLFNTEMFSVLPWGGSLFTVLFSLIFLLVAAGTCEVPWIVKHLERLFDRASATKSPDNAVEP